MFIKRSSVSQNEQLSVLFDTVQKDGEALKLASKGLKDCEEYDEKRKKFKNFKGVQRPMGIMEKKEYGDIYHFWLSFWDNTFLGSGIEDIYSQEGRAQFRARVNRFGDVVVAFAMMLIIESSLHFSASQILLAAVAGYYLSALCFGFCHMSIHARALVRRGYRRRRQYRY